MNLPYIKIGHGTEILLAFHGIGQDFSAFEDFAITFQEQYTTLLFDLPFHGQNQCTPPDKSFSKEALALCIEAILKQEQIERFSLVGFSMGGRFALSIANSFAKRLNQLILIAPDGIKEHPLFLFATCCKVTRFFFKKVIFHPSLLAKGSSLLVRLKLLNPSIQRFSLSTLNTEAKKHQIFNAWVSFRELKYEKSLVRQLNDNAVEVSIYIGRFDKLLPLKKVKNLHNQLNNSLLTLLNSVHTRIIEQTTLYYLNITPKSP